MIDILAIKDVKYEDYNEIWAIVRSLKHPNPHIEQIQDLSPSWDLFSKFQNLKKAGNWNQKTFQEIYVPQFLNEMKSKNARKRLNELYLKDRAKKRIALICFCPDESLCHRSIIAGLLQGCGCEVTGVKQDYAAYFKAYKKG